MARLAILGAGAVGVALARNWTRSGHAVVFGVRDAGSESARAAMEALEGRVEALAFYEAIARADAAVLALPWAAAQEVLPTLDALAGKLLIDATNPLGMTADGLGLLVGHDDSGGEQVARLAPQARVVKSLNQTGAELMADPGVLRVPPVMFVAGDDADARREALALVADLGFDAHDFGPLKGARLLEAFAMTWIHMALFQNAGRGWAFARTNAAGGA